MLNVKNGLRTTVALVLTVFFSTFSWAEPAALATCAACHGSDGKSTDSAWPNLAGQHQTYLEIQLKAYRSGDRNNAVMNGMAAALSDADIEELAAWYAAQPRLTAANGDQTMVEEGRNRAGYCHACHGMQGAPVADEWPILAGQNAAYIAARLAGFKSGLRNHPLMVNVVKDLDAAAMAALGAYYSQVPPAAE